MNHSIQKITVLVHKQRYKMGNYLADAWLEAKISIVQGEFKLDDWKMGEQVVDQDFVEDGSPDTDIMGIFEQKKAKFLKFLSQLKVEDIDLSGYAPNKKLGDRIASRWRTFH